MARSHVLRADAPEVHVAGVIPERVVLPAGIGQRQRLVSIAPERIVHIRRRHPKWLAFCLTHIPTVLSAPDDKHEAWVNSAYPFGDEHLTGRLRKGTL